MKKKKSYLQKGGTISQSRDMRSVQGTRIIPCPQVIVSAKYLSQCVSGL